MKTEKLVIIGSGPAGLTAAIYAARANLNPLVIEGKDPGGQLMGTTAVENWPGEKSIQGPQLIKNMREHAEKTGARFQSGAVTGIATDQQPFIISINGNPSIQAHAIIIATGATPRPLNCPGEKEYWGKGVSTCAVCDGAFYADQPVAVIGGGDTGMESALFLTNFTKKITIVQNKSELTASEAMKNRVLDNKDITIIYNSTVSKIIGDDKGVTGVEIIDQETDKSSILEAHGVFIAIGLNPNTNFVKDKLELTPYGHIKVHNHTKTSVKGIFAAGDNVDARYRQAVTAAGHGCQAALDAESYIKETIKS